MKKKLLFVGMLGALTLASCVDTKESASVENVRNSKAELNKAMAQAELIRANAAAEESKALAAYNQARAAYEQALAEQIKIQNEYQKESNNIELQKKAAELAKLIEQYKNQMEQAALQQQMTIANLQLQLMQAQKALEDYLASLKDKTADIQKYENYSSLYYKEVAQVLYLQSELQQAKLDLDQMKFEGVAGLGYKYDDQQDRLAKIERLQNEIEKNNAIIEENNAKIEIVKSYLETGDTKDLYDQVAMLQMKKKYELASYEKELDALDKARSEAEAKCAEAYAELPSFTNTELWNMWYGSVKINDEDVDVPYITYGDYYDAWSGAEDYSMRFNSSKKSHTYETLTYIDSEGKDASYKVEFNYYTCSVENFSYNKKYTATQIAWMQEEVMNLVKDGLDDKKKDEATKKSHVDALTKYVAYLEEALKDKKDKVTLTKEVVLDEEKNVYSLADIKEEDQEERTYAVCQGIYNKAVSDKADATTELKDAQDQIKEQETNIAAQEKFFELFANEKVLSDFNKAVEDYDKARIEIFKDYALANAKYEVFKIDYSSNEKTQYLSLQLEIEALNAAIASLEAGNNAIAGFEKAIEKAQTIVDNNTESIAILSKEAEYGEEELKTLYANMIANQEAKIAMIEGKLKSAQAVADAYKKILDSIVIE